MKICNEIKNLFDVFQVPHLNAPKIKHARYFFENKVIWGKKKPSRAISNNPAIF